MLYESLSTTMKKKIVVLFVILMMVPILTNADSYPVDSDLNPPQEKIKKCTESETEQISNPNGCRCGTGTEEHDCEYLFYCYDEKCHDYAKCRESDLLPISEYEGCRCGSEDCFENEYCYQDESCHVFPKCVESGTIPISQKFCNCGGEYENCLENHYCYDESCHDFPKCVESESKPISKGCRCGSEDCGFQPSYCYDGKCQEHPKENKTYEEYAKKHNSSKHRTSFQNSTIMSFFYGIILGSIAFCLYDMYCIHTEDEPMKYEIMV